MSSPAEGITIEAVADRNYLKVNFNMYESAASYKYRFFWSEDISDVDIDESGNFVTISLKHERKEWQLSFDGFTEGKRKTLKIESVLGTEPTSNEHLATLLADLRG